MRKSKQILLMALAVILGGGSLLVPSASIAASGDDLIVMCYRGFTIQVPFYLRIRYVARGAMDGACSTSLP